MTFEFPHRIPLAQLPTPIEKLEVLTKSLEGPQIYLKRDDYTGVGLTGNKVRKLEFLLAQAIADGCDHVITCGGYQSNHARTTAVAAAKLGLKCHLVLRDGPTVPLEGNLFLSRLFGAEIEYVTPEQYMQVDEIINGVALDIESDGGKAFSIPEGGSNEIGVMGYVKAAEEIVQQLGNMDLPIHHIVVPVGSGGTYAGLLLGKYIFDLPGQVHGINVCDDKAFFVHKTQSILEKANKRYGLGLKVSKIELSIIDGYVGKGYGLSSQSEIDIIKEVARKEGVILDPVYTGKAMLGLVDQVRKGAFKKDENVLFIHTGGVFGLFPKRSLFF